MAAIHPTSLNAENQEVWADESLIATTRSGIEVWRPIPGTEGRYDVSNFGRVRSWVRKNCPHRAIAPKMLTLSPNLEGYPLAQIFVNAKRRSRPVHQLVAETFIGPRPGNPKFWHVGHYDGSKNNNRLDNVRWCTASANYDDKRRHGTVPPRCRKVG